MEVVREIPKPQSVAPLLLQTVVEGQFGHAIGLPPAKRRKKAFHVRFHDEVQKEMHQAESVYDQQHYYVMELGKSLVCEVLHQRKKEYPEMNFFNA